MAGGSKMFSKLAEIFAWPPGREKEASRANGRSRAENGAADKLAAACRELLSERGEISGARIAAGILTSYQSLDKTARGRFFDLLIRDFSPDPEEVGRAGDAYRDDPSPATLARLQHVVEPPRQELFRRLNIAPGATRVLVEMRADLLREPGENSSREPIGADLQHLLISWFNRGFLVLERIDWKTPANVLEKLIQYEAVHQIHGWSDLRRRLAADRRCYGFFHPALPEEPIIFIEVALTRGMSDKVQPLLDPSSAVADPDSADCALFYSITNCQVGLRGVPFGSFLIKQVVEDLGSEFSKIRRFATLSPVPGFRAWLEENRAALGLGRVEWLLQGSSWCQDERLVAEAKAALLPLCARYLLGEKQGKELIDPVARFHLRNGARLERINWMGDTSQKGFERSVGLTVNYVYRLGDLEKNHESYTRESKIAASYEIEALARQAANGTPKMVNTIVS